MTIGKNSNFGFNVRRMNTDDKTYLVFVFWYPTQWNKRLGYKYASLRVC